MSILRQFLPQLVRSRGLVSTVCQNTSRTLSSTTLEPKEETRPTVRKPNLVQRSELTEFGKYAAECLPKYIQKIQLTAGDELELLIVPEGVLPVLQFLKDHHSAQFANLVDIAGVDIPSREYRLKLYLH